LKNAVAHQLALGDVAALEEATGGEPDTGDVIAHVLAERLPLARARERVVEAFERRYIEAVLQEHGGNVSHAAKASGIARRYFQILKSRMGK
jgi:DNA-binding NtrC family response regulator